MRRRTYLTLGFITIFISLAAYFYWGHLINTSTEITEQMAISLVKEKYPELKNYPCGMNNQKDCFTPNYIESRLLGSTLYLLFVQTGSGVPIVDARCFSVDIAEKVTSLEPTMERGDSRYPFPHPICPPNDIDEQLKHRSHYSSILDKDFDSYFPSAAIRSDLESPIGKLRTVCNNPYSGRATEECDSFYREGERWILFNTQTFDGYFLVKTSIDHKENKLIYFALPAGATALPPTDNFIKVGEISLAAIK